ncbi:hypothetical protein AMTR_s00002p00238600 [Amborella trichopoda]|uniref:Uncharacterized protein n=1 Tax=Amborella trichopoda TaxID=13333 RepID=W1NUC4_AMBTC|nr:hypothetical protein AMTR_s00002p00238600 [Amborella trichopoda]
MEEAHAGRITIVAVLVSAAGLVITAGLMFTPDFSMWAGFGLLGVFMLIAFGFTAWYHWCVTKVPEPYAPHLPGSIPATGSAQMVQLQQQQ